MARDCIAGGAEEEISAYKKKYPLYEELAAKVNEEGLLEQLSKKTLRALHGKLKKEAAEVPLCAPPLPHPPLSFPTPPALSAAGA